VGCGFTKIDVSGFGRKAGKYIDYRILEFNMKRLPPDRSGEPIGEFLRKVDNLSILGLQQHLGR
jgi:hypothetical protein